jgi:hypothetical protein
VSIKSLDTWFQPWKDRIAPQRIAIVGGEPLLNKNICNIIYLSRSAWSSSFTQHFELVTNGFLLHRYADLPRVLVETDCLLFISVHHDNLLYQQKISEIRNLVDKWREKYGIKVHWSEDYKKDQWSQVFKYTDNNIEPNQDNDPTSSWNCCPVGQQCWQLFDSKIYKCAPLAYLKMHKERFGLSKNWDPYLNYQPLNPDCSDQQIRDFFDRRAEPECAMCPSSYQTLAKPDPIDRKKTFIVKHLEPSK